MAKEEKPPPKPICDFCKGEPVGNAARWVTNADVPRYLPCPRCGELNEP